LAVGQHAVVGALAEIVEPGTRSADAVAVARARLERDGSIEAAADLLDDSLFS
jgi:hypothetical protein